MSKVRIPSPRPPRTEADVAAEQQLVQIELARIVLDDRFDARVRAAIVYAAAATFADPRSKHLDLLGLSLRKR